MRARAALSLAEARRVALAAQGFGGGRGEGAAPSTRALVATVRRLGLLQIDSVNVVVRSHFLPLFSRLGAYDRAELERLAYRAPRRLFEYWGHEASLLPVETQPLLRWRMARAHAESWGGMQRVAREQPALVAAVLDEVRARGPVTAGELETGARAGKNGPWWDWSDAKRAVEFLFWAGEVTTHSRRGFERRYAVPERVLPRAVLETPAPSAPDAIRELVRISARASGVAADAHLRDWFRLPVAETKVAIAELVEADELVPVQVEGQPRPWWLHRDARVPRRVQHTALLSPFDQLVWERGRTEALFGFRFRLEIYVPKEQRVHGYYVLPFLHGDRLVGRVDLKSDRQAGVLRVLATHWEPGERHDDALGEELARAAAWLGLGAVA